VTTRQALGKQFNKLLVQLKGFANDSAYGGVNLLQDDQELNVQLGAKFDESTFKVQGFHVAGAATLNENSEVGSVTESSLPVSWKVDPNAGTGYAALAPDSGIQYDPLDRSQWSSLSGVDKVVAGTAANSYTFSMKDGTLIKRSGVVQLEKLNNKYWLASADSSGQIGYGSTVKLYAFALNKVEYPLSLVGIKSYGTDQTAITGHEVDWGLSQSYRDDLKTVLNSIEQVDSVLETRQKLLTFDQSTINLREDYTHEFVNALETGADDLTLADLNEEATNLLALQTAQQLGVQGLSLANQQTQQVLRLLG
jgi:flagellin-like hook-associated protein FlgL